MKLLRGADSTGTGGTFAQWNKPISRRDALGILAAGGAALLASRFISECFRDSFSSKTEIPKNSEKIVLPDGIAEKIREDYRGKEIKLEKGLREVLGKFDNDQKKDTLERIRKGNFDISLDGAYVWDALYSGLVERGYLEDEDASTENQTKAVTSFLKSRGLGIACRNYSSIETGASIGQWIIFREYDADISYELAGRRISGQVRFLGKLLTEETDKMLRSELFYLVGGEYTPENDATDVYVFECVDVIKSNHGLRKLIGKENEEEKREDHYNTPKVLYGYARRSLGYSWLKRTTCRLVVNERPALREEICHYENEAVQLANTTAIHELFHRYLAHSRLSGYFEKNIVANEYCAHMAELALSTIPFEVLSGILQPMLFPEKDQGNGDITAMGPVFFKNLGKELFACRALIEAELPEKISEYQKIEQIQKLLLKLTDDEVRFIAMKIVERDIMPFVEGKTGKEPY